MELKLNYNWFWKTVDWINSNVNTLFCSYRPYIKMNDSRITSVDIIKRLCVVVASTIVALNVFAAVVAFIVAGVHTASETYFNNEITMQNVRAVDSYINSWITYPGLIIGTVLGLIAGYVSVVVAIVATCFSIGYDLGNGKRGFIGRGVMCVLRKSGHKIEKLNISVKWSDGNE